MTILLLSAAITITCFLIGTLAGNYIVTKLVELLRHFVFTAANIPENELAIKMAVHAVSILNDYWDMDAAVTGIYDGSKFTINSNDGNNTSIYAEDDDVHRLIYSCVDFERVLTRLKYKK